MIGTRRTKTRTGVPTGAPRRGADAAGFASATAQVNGTTLDYVRGGKGPPVILIHGFPQDGFEYHAIMPRLAQSFTVVALDLRGTPTCASIRRPCAAR